MALNSASASSGVLSGGNEAATDVDENFDSKERNFLIKEAMVKSHKAL